jgi:phosphatidylserine decarboxylase
MIHQYVDRRGSVCDEQLTADGLISFIYSTVRERNGFLFNKLISRKTTSLLGYINYDHPFASVREHAKVLEQLGVNFSESVDTSFKTVREIFERKIRYDEFRPMTQYKRDIVSPADSRMLVGSFSEHSSLFIKEKFFSFEELLGDRADLHVQFRNGDFCIFRLTPEKYHYNHSPVTGLVLDIYTIDGHYHSCNPGAVVEAVTPYSKNKRVVTIIDTDVAGGSRVGLVAMIEVVAMMIGEIVQCYSEKNYENPRDVAPGLFILRGKPKSMYRPGSSTDILIFQKGRIAFDPRIVANSQNAAVQSRFTIGFGQPICETDIQVREIIGIRKEL